MVHAKELCHGQNNTSVPRQKCQSHKYDVEDQCREEEDGYLGISLWET